MAGNLFQLNLGPYKVQFDQNRYNVELKDDITAIVTVKGTPSHRATVSIFKGDPVRIDLRGIVSDTMEMVRLVEPDLSTNRTAISSPASKMRIDGRAGFYTRIGYRGIDQKTVGYGERVFCLLDDHYVCNIFSIYSEDDKETPRLISSLIETIHIEKQ